MKLKIIRFVFIVVVYLLSNSIKLYAVEYSLVPVLKEHQKRGEEFYCTCQDKNGFLWFGTDMGVVKYDGHKLSYFSVNDGLPDNTVFGFFEDDNNRLWGRTFNGKLFYIKNNKVFTNNWLNENLLKISNKKIPISLCVTDKYIYIGYLHAPPLKINYTSDLNVEILDINKDGIYVYDVDDTNFIYGVFYKKNSNPKTINWRKKNLEIKKFKIKPFVDFYSDTRILKTNNNLLVLMGNEIYYINDNGIIFEQHINGIISGAFANDSNVFIGVEKKGVFAANLTTDSLHFKENILPEYTADVFADRDCNLWITTLEDGVFCLPHYRFQQIHPQQDISKNEVLLLEKENDNALFFVLKDGQSGIYKNKKIEYLKIETGQDFNSLYISPNELWFATKINYFGKIFLIKNKKINDTFKYDFGSVKCMIYNKPDSSVFIAHHNRLSSVKKNINGKYVIDTIATGRVNALTLIDNYLFYGTFDGLWAKNLKDKMKPPVHLLSDIRINHLVAIPDKTIAASTHGKGLLVIGKNLFFKLNSDNGLISDIIKCLCFDEKRKTLWIGTPSGLSRIIFTSPDNKKYVIQNYDINSGLASNIVNDIEILSDTLYVAGKNGITIIPVENLPAKMPKPQLIVNNVRVNKRVVNIEEFSGDLNYRQREVEFNFDAISYSFSPNIIFYYRLLPKDTLWTETKSNSATYENLNYGKNTFELKACTQDKSNCSDVYIKVINVQYPFWFKWWFYLLTIVFIALVGYIIIKLRLKNVKSKLKVKKMLLDAEKKALRAQMNPHFIFNALTSIQKFILTNNVEQADYYVRQFAKLIRLILDTSRHTTINLTDEISILRLYLELEKLRMNDKFDFIINLDNITATDTIMIPSMLIQPIVENAVWHGIADLKTRKGLITISFSQNNDIIKCVIEDNGVGRIKNYKEKVQTKFKSSLGYSITRQRIELSQKIGSSIDIQDVIDENGTLSGTRVVIFI